jgi:hypothetical protein
VSFSFFFTQCTSLLDAILSLSVSHESDELGGLKPGNSCTKAVLHAYDGRIIWVALPGPKEALEAIFTMTRDQVDMEMWHALTDPVIDSHKCSIGL